MTNNISQKIKNLPEIEFPEGLHSRIMKQLFFLKLRTPFIIFSSLLSINIIISGWYAWNKIIEMDTIAIIKDMLSGFELSYYFISDFAQTILNYFPITSTIIFVVNILVLAYISFLFIKLKRIETKGRMV
jgi:hypothetical protein